VSHTANKGIAGIEKHTHRARGVSGRVDDLAAYAILGQGIVIVAQHNIGFGSGSAMKDPFQQRRQYCVHRFAPRGYAGREIEERLFEELLIGTVDGNLRASESLEVFGRTGVIEITVREDYELDFVRVYREFLKGFSEGVDFPRRAGIDENSAVVFNQVTPVYSNSD
jgi:hypothetical protein